MAKRKIHKSEKSVAKYCTRCIMIIDKVLDTGEDYKMKRVEITYRSNMNELNKLNARLERAEKAFQKKLAVAEKYGVAEWTGAQRREWLATVPTENGWIQNKEDIKKNGAWIDLAGAKDDLQTAKEAIERAEARFDKAEQELKAYHEELDRLTDLQAKEELMKKEFEEEQKEWKKDGITLNGRYWGETPKGKRFNITGNNGWTRRSLHCFTLMIDGNCIFTSGEFWRAYGVIKNS